MKLTAEQISFFKDNGYLLLKNVLDLTQCEAVMDRVWDSLPETNHLKIDDPNTHVGPFEVSEEQDSSLNLRMGYRWQVREFSTEPELLDLVFSKNLLGVAEQLLGEDMVEPPVPHGKPMGHAGPAWPGGPVDPADTQGIRGVYCTLPYGDQPREADTGHTDGHPFNIGVVGLLDDVPKEGGAFKVWPRSHRRLYPTFQMQYDQPRIPFYEHLPSYKGIIHSQAYLDELEAVMQDTSPVDCYGEAGDVVLWHHRLAHMAGHNYSRVIRQAVLSDFVRKDLDTCRLDPPQQNMWRDWSTQVQGCNAGYSKAFALEQRLPKELLSAPVEIGT